MCHFVRVLIPTNLGHVSIPFNTLPVSLSIFLRLNVIFICIHRCLKDEVNLEFHGFHVGLSTCGKMRLFNFFSVLMLIEWHVVAKVDLCNLIEEP